mgnify:FL=1|jgi:hypothetical protein
MNEDKKHKFKLNKYINQKKYLESYYLEQDNLRDEYQLSFNNDFKHELEVIRKRTTNEIIDRKEELAKKMEEDENDVYYEEYIHGNNDSEMLSDEVYDEISDEKPNTNLFSILLKKIYRKLAKITHPDKHNYIEDRMLFNKIKNLYANGDLLELLIIACEFKIDILAQIDKAIISINNNNIFKEQNDILNALYEHFDVNMTTKNNQIEEMKNTVAWAWGNADNEHKKMNVRNHLYKMWNFNNEEIEILNNMKNNRKNN